MSAVEDFVTSLGAAETVDYAGDVASTVRQRHPGAGGSEPWEEWYAERLVRELSA